MLVQVGDTKVEVRAEAVLSGPRFGPLINVFGFIEAMMPLHIRPTLGQGAYWSQVLTRMLEQFEPTTEYIITLDMDSFISKENIEHLFALAMTSSSRGPVRTSTARSTNTRRIGRTPASRLNLHGACPNEDDEDTDGEALRGLQKGRARGVARAAGGVADRVGVRDACRRRRSAAPRRDKGTRQKSRTGAG
ncbi:hypothetical protein EB118_24170 [bacterium]|nr:hypothetical protein [bacterium]